MIYFRLTGSSLKKSWLMRTMIRRRWDFYLMDLSRFPSCLPQKSSPYSCNTCSFICYACQQERYCASCALVRFAIDKVIIRSQGYQHAAMVTCIMHYIDGDFKHVITTNGNYFLLLVTKELLEEANALLLIKHFTWNACRSKCGLYHE